MSTELPKFAIPLAAVVVLLLIITAGTPISTPKKPQPIYSPTSATDWKEYRNGNFKISFPNHWKVTSSEDRLDGSSGKFKFIVGINIFGNPGLPSCKVIKEKIDIDGLSTTKYILSFCDTEKFNLFDQECRNTKCFHHIESSLCLDSNFNLYESELGCESMVRNNNYSFYQFHLECNNKTIGDDAKNKCSKLYNQILSTFKFLD